MDMKLDPNAIKALRARRAWSQEHLAAAAELAVRTIQRAEASGSASYQTTQALAAAFGIEVSALRSAPTTVPPTGSPWSHRPLLAIAAGLAAFIIVAFVLVRPALARSVMVDVALTWVDGSHNTMQVITGDGKEAVVDVDKQFRLVVVPTVKANHQVLLATRLYENDGKTLTLKAQPGVLTADGVVAIIRSTMDNGGSFEIQLTPHILAR